MDDRSPKIKTSACSSNSGSEIETSTINLEKNSNNLNRNPFNSHTGDTGDCKSASKSLQLPIVTATTDTPVVIGKVEEVINNISVILPNLIEESLSDKTESGCGIIVAPLHQQRLARTPDYSRKAHSSPVHETRRHSSEDGNQYNRPVSCYTTTTHVGELTQTSIIIIFLMKILHPRSIVSLFYLLTFICLSADIWSEQGQRKM